MELHDIHIDEAKLAEFCRANHIVELLVFGSATRSDFRNDSDIDVAITYEPNVKISLIDFAAHELDLTKLLGREVHLTERSTIPARYSEHFLRGAITAYAA
ncbi:MAG TPA: nucleotidyltransferase domain-containing protein [Tepidisphaeraceae bacterium]|nr:nucleotidyltransferase domain-containing protein [Tepidisphaeraceae bacterium]